MLKRLFLVLVMSGLAVASRGMNVYLGTGSNPIKARVFIVDPQGRRFGQDPQTGTFYYEVPNKGYDRSSIAVDDGSGDATPESEVFYIAGPHVTGNYMITVYALEPSTYTLTILAGPVLETIGSLVVNGRVTYQLAIDTSPGAPPPTLVKVGAIDKPILPILACVEKKDEKGHWGHRHGHHKFRGHRRRHPFRHKRHNKELIAVFGYENQNAGAVEVPVGPDNKFAPPPPDRGQTETFDPGVVEEAFEVPFGKKEALTWTLKGPDGQLRSVTADKRSPECR